MACAQLSRSAIWSPELGCVIVTAGPGRGSRSGSLTSAVLGVLNAARALVNQTEEDEPAGKSSV
jgi:hypothetical protein